MVSDEHTNEYYKGKVVLITGGGGSIGSELCRQLAKMQPKQIVILDIYENGAYDVQQELKNWKRDCIESKDVSHASMRILKEGESPLKKKYTKSKKLKSTKYFIIR